MKPRIEAKLQQAVAVPPLHLLGRGHAGCDHRPREGFADHGVGRAHDGRVKVHLRRRAGLQPADCKPLTADDPRAQSSRQRRGELAILADGHAIGELVEIGGVDRNAGRTSGGDDVGDRLPLIGLTGRVPGRGEQAAKAIAADGEPLDRLVAARIVENQDRPPPRMHVFGIEHRGDHRFLEILAGDQQPQIDALRAHDRGDDRIEPAGENAVFGLGPLARGKDRRQGRCMGFGLAHGDGRRRGGSWLHETCGCQCCPRYPALCHHDPVRPCDGGYTGRQSPRDQALCSLAVIRPVVR